MDWRQIKSDISYYVSDFCRARKVSPHEMQEMVQLSLIRVWKGIDSFDKLRPIKPWTKTVTQNTCRNYLRDKYWGATTKTISLDKFIYTEDGFETGHSIYAEREIHNEYFELLGTSLTKIELRILNIFVAGMSPTRLAALLGIDRQKIYKIRKEIRAKYQKALN